ncbi:MAG: hypothetical protein ACFFBP_02145 [Promethearchaeota archaeon]
MLFIDIFRLDWILIDSIIIIILLIILFGVKVFIKKTRWRNSFSHIELLKKKIKDHNLSRIGEFYSIRRINLVSNLKLSKHEPIENTIITFLKNEGKKIHKLLIRGLSSYGFDVVNVNIDFKNKINGLEEIYHKEALANLIIELKAILQKYKLNLNSYTLILDSKAMFLKYSMLSSINNKALILINPKINKFLIRKLSNILSDTNLKQKLLIIFSKKSFFFLNNINLKKFLKLYPDYEKRDLNIKIIEKSRKLFKYYETFLLGMVIDFLESFI